LMFVMRSSLDAAKVNAASVALSRARFGRFQHSTAVRTPPGIPHP
jgi:hypothetical protein